MESIEYKVVDQSGRQTGTVALDARIFQAPIDEHMVHGVVVWQRAKQRSGTHATQTRTMMEGGGKKPWKQKGTGRARHGSNISPLWVGGAVTFGPHPRNYETRVTKRAKAQALRSALSDKVAQANLVIIDDLKLPAMKTKEMVSVLQSVGASDGRSLILLDGKREEGNEIVAKSSRNIAGVKALTIDGLNVYDVLNHKYLICTKQDILSLQEKLTERKG